MNNVLHCTLHLLLFQILNISLTFITFSKCKNEVLVYFCFSSSSYGRKTFLKDWGWSLVNRQCVWVDYVYRIIPETQWSIVMEVNRHFELKVFHVVFERWGLSRNAGEILLSSSLWMHAKYCLFELLPLHVKCKLYKQLLISEVLQMRLGFRLVHLRQDE